LGFQVNERRRDGEQVFSRAAELHLCLVVLLLSAHPWEGEHFAGVVDGPFAVGDCLFRTYCPLHRFEYRPRSAHEPHSAMPVPRWPDTSILIAWHRRRVHSHIEQLTTIRDRPGSAGERLEAVLEACALILHEHHATPVAALLHRGEHVARARQQLLGFIRDLLSEGARAGEFRDDVAADELASYSLHALSGASSLTSKAAARRLVTVTLAGLRAPR
jgi:hypothetical protein